MPSANWLPFCAGLNIFKCILYFYSLRCGHCLYDGSNVLNCITVLKSVVQKVLARASIWSLFLMYTLYPPDCFVDIAFVMDGSGSVTEPNWDVMKSYVMQFASWIDLGPDDSQIGVVTFGNDASLDIRLDDNSDMSQLEVIYSAVSLEHSTFSPKYSRTSL